MNVYHNIMNGRYGYPIAARFYSVGGAAVVCVEVSLLECHSSEQTDEVFLFLQWQLVFKLRSSLALLNGDAIGGIDTWYNVRQQFGIFTYGTLF